jgi:hypothetical protein
VFRFAKFKSESLELRSKAFLSFFVIISKVEFLAAMVNRKNLTDEQCVRLKDCLLEHLTNDELPRGILRVAAVKFSVTQTVSRLWKGWRASHAMALNSEWDVTSKKKACGWGLKYSHDDIGQAVCEIPLRQRSTVWLLQGALTILQGTIHCLIRTEKILRSHSSAVKPMLTEENNLSRMEFCLSERGANELFKDIYGCIHVDEKMFLLTREVEWYILAGGEEAPHRTVAHKSYIPKVMFCAANARRRWDAGGNQFFDERVGMWPIATQVPAARSSRNRPAGTLESGSHIR